MNLHELFPEEYFPLEETYSFDITVKELKKSLGLLGLVAKKEDKIKCSLGEDRIYLSVFSNDLFLCSIVGIEGSTHKSALGDNPAFIVEWNQFSRLTKNLTGTLRIGYNAKKSELNVKAGDSSLEISTYPETDFGEFRSKAIPILDPVEIDPAKYLKGITYANCTYKPNDYLPLDSLEIVKSRCAGGKSSAVNIVEFDSPDDVTLNFSQDYSGMMMKFLTSVKNTLHFTESEEFYILYTDSEFIGIRKSKNVFPDVNQLWDWNDNSIITFDGVELLTKLKEISTIQYDLDSKVRVRITVEGKMFLSLKDSLGTGREAKTSLPVQKEESYVGEEFWVNFQDLMKVISTIPEGELTSSMGRSKWLIKSSEEGLNINSILVTYENW